MGRGERRGSTLAIVAALVLVIAAGALMLQRAMHQQYGEAHRYAHGEVATQLAQSGLNLFMEHLRQVGATPGSDLYATLVETPAADLEGVSSPLESPHLTELVRCVGSGASLEVWVEFKGFAPFIPRASYRGVATDPREKHGELAVVARAEYRGVVRTMTAFRAVKVCSVVPPVVSKFTLFVRTRGGQEPNVLAYDAFGSHRFSLGGREASPLVLHHGAETAPALVDGRFSSLATVLGAAPPDRGGLVYLGGDEPWSLNLTHGVGIGPYEELHLLRRTRYRIPTTRPGVGFEYGLTFGFYRGLFRSEKFGAWRSPAAPPDRDGSPVPEGTSALHLYGDRDRVSPTLVLGSVARRFVSLRLLDGLWYPLRTPAEFEAGGGIGAFPRGYGDYAQVMCRVVEEPYNRGLDYLATNEEGTEDDGGVASAPVPFVPPQTLPATGTGRVRPALDEDRALFYPEPGRPAPASLRLVRPGPGGEGEELFRGSLADLDGDVMERLLVAKATVRVRDQAELFARYLRRGFLDLPGIVLVEAPDVELPELWVVRSGMLLVRGNLVVAGGIAGPEVGPPLALVALGGDLRIATRDPVRAALVALKGRISSRGRLTVEGSMAAERLDLHGMVAGSEPKVVGYDPDLDPTEPEAFRRHFRVLLDGKVSLRLDGS